MRWGKVMSRARYSLLSQEPTGSSGGGVGGVHDRGGPPRAEELDCNAPWKGLRLTVPAIQAHT